MKVCNTCKQDKDEALFYVWSGKLSNICKPCNRAKSSSWQKRNSEKYSQRQAAYRSAKANELRSYNREYYAENSQRIKAKVSDWKVENKAYVLSNNAERRASKIKAVPVLSEDEAEFNALCMTKAYDLARTRSSNLESNWHVDHIVPLKSKYVCGLHWYRNIQVIPAIDNLRKSNKEWENR